MRCLFRDSWLSGDAGSTTAEFAIALPAVILVLVACLSGVQIAGQQLRMQDAAAVAARAAARGDSTNIAGRLLPGAKVDVHVDGDVICVTVRMTSSQKVGALLGLELRASSCAVGGGR